MLVDNDDTMSICSFGSRADLSRLNDAPVPTWIQTGEPVIVLSSHGAPQKNGTVCFVGVTEFAAGNWIGVALEHPEGRWRLRGGGFGVEASGWRRR